MQFGVVVPMREVGAYLRANRKTVLCHNFGFACISFASYGSGAWVPTFFESLVMASRWSS